MRVGYQGGDGAYSHIAATRHFKTDESNVECVGFPAFAPMLKAVKSGDIACALLPIENSIAGSINESYDLIANLDLFLTGEVVQHIDHCLIGFGGISVGDLKRVYSHPVALAQCGHFLETLEGCKVEAYNDTALSVKKVKNDADKAHAAIASEKAAQIYGLSVLKRGIADQNENYTRMVVVAGKPVEYSLDVFCKTSLMFATSHVQGALARCISLFSERGINLTKLESRPKANAPFEYVFYLDVEANTSDSNMAAVLEELKGVTSYLKVFGSYPAETHRQRSS